MTAIMADPPRTRGKHETVKSLAAEAFALVVRNLQKRYAPDARNVIVTDDKGNELEDDLDSCIARCELVENGVTYRGTVWVNVCGRTTAKLNLSITGKLM